MRHFFTTQMDYVLFCYGLSFVFLAALCFALRRRDGTGLPWIWLGLFGLAQGLNEWRVMMTGILKDGPAIEAAKGLLLILSFTCLAAFGRAVLIGPGRSVATRRWIMVGLAGLCLLGGLAGQPGLLAAARYALGFPAALAGAWLLWTAGRRKDAPGGLWLRLAAVSLGLYGVAAGLIPSYAGFPPACWIHKEAFVNLTGVPVEVVRGFSAIGIAIALYVYLCTRDGDAARGRHRAHWLFLGQAALIIGIAILLCRSALDRDMVRLTALETSNVDLGASSLDDNMERIKCAITFVAHSVTMRNAVDEPSPVHVAEVTDDFVALVRAHGIYAMACWLDETGMEVVRVDYEHGHAVVIPKEELQDKGRRYFFTDAFRLNAGEIFVSPLDLSIEHDEIEIPYKPMIRIGMPLFNSAGRKCGIVLLNYSGTDLIQKFAAASAAIADHAMILNRDGYWLHSATPADDWGFMFERPVTLGTRFPAAWSRIQSTAAGQFQNADGLWTFQTVFPLVAGQQSSTGAAQASAPSRGPVETRQYYWKVVSHVPAETLSAASRPVIMMAGLSSAVLLVLALFGSWSLASAWVMKEHADQALRVTNRQLELAAKALLREREKLTAIFDASPVGMLLMDENTVVIAVNDVAAKLAGKTPTEMINTQHGTALDCIHASDDARGCGHGPCCPSCPIRAAITGVLASGKAAHAIEVQATLVVRGTRVCPWLKINAEPVTIDGRRHVIAAIVNITERKAAEQELRGSREFLYTIINCIRDPIFVMDDQQRFVLANDAFLHRRSRKEVLGRMVSDIFPPEIAADLMRTNQRVLTTGADSTTEEQTLGAQNQVLTVITTKSLYVDPSDKRHVVGIVRDITDQKHAEEKIHVALALAEQANAAKSTFLANMSHEIRTPMTAILGFTEMLGRSLECCTTCPEYKTCPIHAQSREALQVIQRNGTHLLGLINDILDLSKIEAGKMEVERVLCSPVQLVEETVSLLRVKAIEKGLSLDARYEFPLPETMRSDPAKVRQVLVNLVGNAVKFTSQGRVEIVVRCTTVLPPGRAALAFEVKDTGVGLTPEQMGRIFQPFVQADSSTTRQFGGTGLGLAISKRLAETLGGDIQVASIPGEGSTFTFTMEPQLTTPADRVRDLSEVAARASHTPPSLVAPVVKLGGRVLLAEDGPDNQRLIAMILGQTGTQVDLAPNGRVAVEMAKAAVTAGTPYDAILMDMQMPEMDGYEATRQLRASGYDRPIIALTAHAMTGDRAKCIAAGCDDYATKPVDRTALLNTLARLMHCPQPEPPDESAPAAPSCEDAIRSSYRADPDMVGIIADFVSQLPQRLAAMRQAAANNQWDVLQRLAHQIKGAGGSYGYTGLTDAARELESHAQQSDAEAAVIDLATLTHLCERVQAGHAADAAPPEPSAPIGEARKP